MQRKLSYEELQQKVHQLEKQAEKSRRIESKLKESEERLTDIANNALAWIWEIDSTGKYVYSSPVVKHILGYAPKEVIGKYFYDFFHPDEKEKLKDLAFKAMANKRAFRRFLNRNVDIEGNTVILSTSGVPIMDSKGTLIGYRGADTDITSAYMAEEELRINEEHLRSLLESASGFAVYRLMFDRSSPHSLRVIFISPSIEDIIGIPEPMKFETWFDYIHNDDLDRITKANQRAFETRRFDEEYRTFNPKKGEWKWIHAISTGGTDANGWNSYVNGILIDITEKQKAFEKLKLHEKRLENKTRDLKQMNEALAVLLKKREQDKIDIQNKVTENINQLVLPYLMKIGKPTSKSEITALIDIIRSNLNEITAGFSHQLSANYIGLSPKEIRVADLVRQGHKTKQIAQFLYLSPKTVESHRENIRKKLGIKNKKINLQSYLQAIE